MQNRALRRIEYCKNQANRLENNELKNKYKMEELSLRRKRSLLRIMYDQSKEEDNIDVISHDINVRSRGKIKLKNKFSRLMKLHSSPYYHDCVLWSNLPEEIQKSEREIFP